MISKIFMLASLTMAIPAYSKSLEIRECLKPVEDRDIYRCTKEELERADTLLNEKYIQVRKSIRLAYKNQVSAGDELLNHLKRSQRSWLTVREENCKVENFFVDSQAPAYEFMIGGCIVRETLERIDYLDRLGF